MLSRNEIASILKEIASILGRDGGHRLPRGDHDVVKGSRCRPPESRFEFGESLFYRVAVWGVARCRHDPAPRRFDQLSSMPTLVHAQVIPTDDLAGV